MQHLRDMTLLVAPLLGFYISCTPEVEYVVVPEDTSTYIHVVAKLESMSTAPECEFGNHAAVAVYTDVTVLEGKYDGNALQVIHGCPNMPRVVWAPDSGNLEQFTIGDYHHMILTERNMFTVDPIYADDGLESQPRFFCRRVSLHDFVEHDE